MMANQVFLFVLLFLRILKFGNGYYYYSGTTERMKWKVIYLERELIKAAIRNVQRIEYMREYYSDTPVFDLGQMLYYLRSRFSRMVRVFVISHENDGSFKTFHWHLPAMKEMHDLGLEIYHLIEMLEEFEKKSHLDIANVKVIQQSRHRHKTTTPEPSSTGGESLRRRPINIPSFSKKGFYARKPNEAGRKGIMVNRPRDVDAVFESDIE